MKDYRYKLFDFTTREGKAKFYAHKWWIAVRNGRRNKDPWCVICYKEGKLVPVEEIDHIKDLETHPELALRFSNTQSLCKSCHSKKTFKTRTMETIKKKKKSPGGKVKAFPQGPKPI